MKWVLIIPAALLLVGCQNANIRDEAEAPFEPGTSELRVTEYGGRVGGLTQYGGVAGCRVIQKGTVSVYMTYHGKRCAVSTLPGPL